MPARPSPATVKAKRREIARRYAKRRAKATKPQFAAIRIAELNRLFMCRYGLVLPDSAVGRECLHIIAQHIMQLAGPPQGRFIAWAEARAPWLTLTEMRAILADVVQHPMQWRADSLAWRLRLNYADRQTLKITTIGATDCSQAQRKARRREMQRKCQKRLWQQRKLCLTTIIGLMVMLVTLRLRLGLW